MRRLFASFILVTHICVSIFSVHAETKAELEQNLKDLEAQIAALTQNIDQTKKQGTSLSNDIKLLQQKIEQSKLKIKAHSTAITKLTQHISEKNKTLTFLDDKMNREMDSLAQVMRKTQYQDQYSLLDFGLQTKSLSTFFSDVDSFSTLNRALNDSFDEIRSTKADLEEVKSELIDAKDEETQRKLAEDAERKKVELNQQQKNSLLAITKNQQGEYQKVLTARQKEAAQIRARLFALRDSKSIPFGTAYDYAVQASKTTGVRPALILAILMQESSLGIDVGACYVKDTTSGDGVSIKSGDPKPRTMHPTRDIPVFKTILASLGRDMASTPVSCWIPIYSSGNPTGWGGAMGPSQFIPSTWQIFIKRIQSSTGDGVADPWNPYHAITATALYLKDLGAVSGDENSERNAACKYYSGRACSQMKEAAGYGNSVMKKLYSVQDDIDKLQK